MFYGTEGHSGKVGCSVLLLIQRCVFEPHFGLLQKAVPASPSSKCVAVLLGWGIKGNWVVITLVCCWPYFIA